MRINGQLVPGVDVVLATISQPVQKLTTANLPGAHGTIDTSTELTGGEPVYEDRTLTMRIRELATDPRAAFRARLNAWHGRRVDIDPDGQPGHYTGRIWLTGYAKRAGSFGYVLTGTVKPWRWDDQDTTTQVTATSTGAPFTLTPAAFTVPPLVTCTQAITIVIGTTQYGIPQAVTRYRVAGLVLRPGQPITGTVKGAGLVTFAWRGGQLI